MAVKLSILIATMPSRVKNLAALKLSLEPQITDNNYKSIQLLYDWSMDYNIGTKRNKLLQQAQGEYIVYIDDDDHISNDYISKILTACQTGADCIGISGFITTNGTNRKQWHISKEYKRWHERNGIYYRTPNHISPVKRELALQAGFPEVAFGEDAEYSRRLLPLLKSETIVHGEIYHYDYWKK